MRYWSVVFIFIFAVGNPLHIVGSDRDDDSDTKAHDSIFEHLNEISIEGTEDFPLFRVSSMDVSDDRIAIVDGTIPRITLYDFSGEPQFATGRQGSGPGDLIAPRWIGFVDSDRLAVIEGAGNNRIQLFSTEDGESVGTISRNVLFPGRHAFVDQGGDEPQLWMSLRAACPDDGSQQCVVQNVGLESGEVSARFGTTEEISPGAVGVPWILGQGASGSLYVSHTTAGGYIAAYDERGTLLNRFAMDESPSMNVLNWDEIPDSPEEYFELLQDGLQTSSIWALHVIGEDILVEHENRGGDGPSTRQISVFGKDGSFKTTVPIDYWGHVVKDDRIFFVDEVDKDAEYGSFAIHEYRYTGVAE